MCLLLTVFCYADVTFPKEVYLGDLKPGSKASKRILGVNTSDRPQVIKNIRVSCGCTATNYLKEIIDIDEEAWIDINYTAGRKVGKTSKNIYVHFENNNTFKKIKIIANIIGDPNKAKSIKLPKASSKKVRKQDKDRTIKVEKLDVSYKAAHIKITWVSKAETTLILQSNLPVQDNQYQVKLKSEIGQNAHFIPYQLNGKKLYIQIKDETKEFSKSFVLSN